ncbi:MAG: alpha/beta hydrolase [Thioalkalivibrio sp.]|nr:alpha/beta hydrolase [Thioalkalivibrio sp.]
MSLPPAVIRFAVAGAAVAGLFFMDRVANLFVRPKPRAPDRTIDELYDVAYQDFRIPAGGHELAAWELRPAGEPRRPVFLIAHGWGASYGTILRLGEPLARAGFEVVLFDVRGHGRNEPLPYVTVRHFRDDIDSALHYMKGRYPGRPVILVGHSLGGAGAILAVADGAPLDGLVLIAAPADVMRVTAEYLTDHGMPGRFIVTAFRPFFWRRIGSTFRELTPSRRIREVKVPMLLLQPEHDDRVVRDHADRLSAAAAQPYVLIEGAEHTDVLEHPKTVALVEEFARRFS